MSYTSLTRLFLGEIVTCSQAFRHAPPESHTAAGCERDVCASDTQFGHFDSMLRAVGPARAQRTTTHSSDRVRPAVGAGPVRRVSTGNGHAQAVILAQDRVNSL